MESATAFCLFCATVMFCTFLALMLFFQAHEGHPRISNEATYAQVVRNFAGRPYATGHFVSGYSCAGYTSGRHGHGWVVVRCSK